MTETEVDTNEEEAMLDFTPVREKRMTLAEFTAGLTAADLRRLTDEMLDTMRHIVDTAEDADVVFVPRDPQASDPGGNPDERESGWTLSHVIAHATASSEEAAAIAASLARGVPFEGRSRYETDWHSMTTAAQVRQRLEESRRIRQSYFNAWPDEPHLDVTYAIAIPGMAPMNAITRATFGLAHEDAHLNQLREILRQARAARGQG